MANLSFDVIERGYLIINIDGDIEHGDAQRLRDFVVPVRAEHGAIEGPTMITVSFNSDGGDYLEGIELGRLLNIEGYRSLVKNGNRCHSAAAFAFLGGAGLGATGGWYPDRFMEFGALIGFHTFSITSEEQAPLAKSIDEGKFLTTALINYAEAMRVETDFIVEALHTPADELLILKMAKHLRQLKINLIGYEERRPLNEESSVLAANYATNWRRPISLYPNEAASQAVVTIINARDFKKRVLNLLLERFDIFKRQFDEGLIAILHREINRRKEIDPDQIYSELLAIDVLPSTSPSDDVYHIEGFLFGGGFYTVECFIWGTGAPDSIHSLTSFLVSTARDFDVQTFSKKGDIIYELHNPDENVSGA